MNALQKLEYGDFQTPQALVKEVLRRMSFLDICPDVVIEPTCGLGGFVIGAHDAFPNALIEGYEINADYLAQLRNTLPKDNNVKLTLADFFATDWDEVVRTHQGKRILFLGNPPWVTSSALGSIGSNNLPKKSNFLNFKGFDAITGKANFDISEWMLLRLLQAMSQTPVVMAMLVKTQVARKVIAFADRNGIEAEASIHLINAKEHFNASVDACLFVLKTTGKRSTTELDYKFFPSLDAVIGTIVGNRNGLPISNLDDFKRNSHLVGASPQKWRSGVKHDASIVMELTKQGDVLVNGLGEEVDLEDTFLFPLMKGSDVAQNAWRKKYVIVTQKTTKDDTSAIEHLAPKTWDYLCKHGDTLDARGSSIYAKNARFALFGVGDYSFRPYRVAICGLYKKLAFRLVEPIENKPVMFDDTVYYVSFNTKEEAEQAFGHITAKDTMEVFSSLIFWDEKRPIKSSVLNCVDWTKSSVPKSA